MTRFGRTDSSFPTRISAAHTDPIDTLRATLLVTPIDGEARSRCART